MSVEYLTYCKRTTLNICNCKNKAKINRGMESASILELKSWDFVHKIGQNIFWDSWVLQYTVCSSDIVHTSKIKQTNKIYNYVLLHTNLHLSLYHQTVRDMNSWGTGTRCLGSAAYGKEERRPKGWQHVMNAMGDQILIQNVLLHIEILKKRYNIEEMIVSHLQGITQQRHFSHSLLRLKNWTKTRCDIY